MISSVPSGRTQRTAHTKADSSLKFISCNPFQKNKDESIGQSPKQDTKQVQQPRATSKTATLGRYGNLKRFLTNLTDILTNILDTATCINKV